MQAPDAYPRTQITSILKGFYWWSRKPGNPSAEEHREQIRKTMDDILAAIAEHQDATGYRLVRGNPCPYCLRDLSLDVHGRCTAQAEADWIGYDEGIYRVAGPADLAAIATLVNWAFGHGSESSYPQKAVERVVAFLEKQS